MQCLYEVTLNREPDKATLKDDAYALKCTDEGLFNDFHQLTWCWFRVALVAQLSTWEDPGSSSVWFYSFLRSAPTGKKNFPLPPWLVAPRKRFNIACRMDRTMTNLMMHHCALWRYIGRILLERTTQGLLNFWDRSVVTEMLTFCLAQNLRRMRLILDLPLVLRRILYQKLCMAQISHCRWA